MFRFRQELEGRLSYRRVTLEKLNPRACVL